MLIILFILILITSVLRFMSLEQKIKKLHYSQENLLEAERRRLSVAQLFRTAYYQNNSGRRLLLNHINRLKNLAGNVLT